MTELLSKISSYNIFNYLLPGVIFAAASNIYVNHSFIQNDWLIGLFVYYFTGLVISRVGSLVIQPILMKIGFIKFADHTDLIEASKKDPKIDILSEQNNMFRTFITTFALLIIFKFYKYLETIFPTLSLFFYDLIIVGLLALFIFSYRKQTDFTRKRIEQALSK